MAWHDRGIIWQAIGAWHDRGMACYGYGMAGHVNVGVW